MVKGKGRRTLHLVRQLSFPMVLGLHNGIIFADQIVFFSSQRARIVHSAWSTRAASEKKVVVGASGLDEKTLSSEQSLV